MYLGYVANLFFSAAFLLGKKVYILVAEVVTNHSHLGLIWFVFQLDLVMVFIVDEEL